MPRWCRLTRPSLAQAANAAPDRQGVLACPRSAWPVLKPSTDRSAVGLHTRAVGHSAPPMATNDALDDMGVETSDARESWVGQAIDQNRIDLRALSRPREAGT